ncbi:MAG: ferredoxin [Candidatus Thermofonsia Clade 1 bacterium]|uniref:Ferredoxin n=1 Tax=Candidatus Thermofonsia Clade 1 bacterium TaxID=2364210 RepID=A0A2M8PFY6_9CHLR|nr:MAG: ferredoxin [Candidatus Thermofonsia Clade 1 bacterium]RMF50126.1 MAG: (2Fe-2S) ferredoxin domain-containing protein [Chloroflexota bacterium]
MSQPPKMAPYARHIFICVGDSCDSKARGRKLYKKLKDMLGDLANYESPLRVKRGETPCLGVCSGGVIAVVYPEGVWYHNLDEEKLARIVEEHLRGGKPVEEYVFHRLADNPHAIFPRQAES